MKYKNYWNWQQKDWPTFTYNLDDLEASEQEFLKQSGISFGVFKHLKQEEKEDLKITLMSNEAFDTSSIEGVILDRESIQSSIKRQFGLKSPSVSQKPSETGIAEMMIDLHSHFDKPLTHDTLYGWHKMLMNGRRDIKNLGSYRTHTEPMQIISGYARNPKVHFEAPPSQNIPSEMEQFIRWFNETSPKGKRPLPPLIRSGITHLYFVCIHPFEDGNGRIGRALVEKSLAQSLNQPTLISLSHIINDKKKPYYAALETQNKNNQITEWLAYFSKTVLCAQKYTIEQVEFIIKKTLFFDEFRGQMNERQHKVVTRLFHEGVNGFKGGLSAENYMNITQAPSSTATRDLRDLVNKTILTRTGNLKYTRYYLSLGGER